MCIFMSFYDKKVYFFHNMCAGFQNLTESLNYFGET